MTVRALYSAINDRVAKGSQELVLDMRMRWVAEQRAAGAERDFPDLVIDRKGLSHPSFLILGDPGEADASQYVVVAPLLAADKTDFMVICSDVVYPAGDVNDYIDAFYRPYENYEGEIFALPGNHDWYDGLNGFMYHFCRAEALPPTSFNPSSFSLRTRIARRLWKRADAPKRSKLAPYQRRMRAGRGWAPSQPGPYFAIETGPLLIVAIDTGIEGEIDREQGEWLKRVSATIEKPKILLTGRPLYVDNACRPGEIFDDPTLKRGLEIGADPRADSRPHNPRIKLTVDDIVRDPDNGYVAVIGGDVHNYQYYEVDKRPERCGDRNRLVAIVSGGGGAYLSNTHRVLFETQEGCPPALELYPSRPQSLALYSRPFTQVLLTACWSTLAFYVASAFVFALTRGEGEQADVKWAFVATATALLLGVALIWVLELGARMLGRGRGRGLGAGRAHPAAALASLVPIGLFVGAATSLGSRWLIGPDAWIAAAGLACAACPAIVVAAADRPIINDYPGLPWLEHARDFRLPKPRLFAIGAGLAGLGIALGLIAWKAEDTTLMVVSSVLAVIALPVVLTRIGAQSFPGHEPIVVVLGLSAIGAMVFWWHERTDVFYATLVCVATLTLLPISLILSDYLRRARPTVYRWYSVGILLVIWGGLAGILYATDNSTYVQIAIGTLLALVALVAALALVYLLWINALHLFWRWGDRTGLEIEDAASYFDWEAAHTGDKPCKRTLRIARTIMPGGHERSPLHQLVSEMFNPRKPPFYKNFLRLSVDNHQLTISVTRVTGCDPEPGEHRPGDWKTIPPIPLTPTR